MCRSSWIIRLKVLVCLRKQRCQCQLKKKVNAGFRTNNKSYISVSTDDILSGKISRLSNSTYFSTVIARGGVGE